MIAEIITFGARVACLTFLVGAAVLGAIAVWDWLVDYCGLRDGAE